MKPGSTRRRFAISTPLAVVTGWILAGCTTLLPTAETATRAPWGSFEEARREFEKIEPGKTTGAELRARGIDPFTQRNVAIVDYAELIRRFALPGIDSLAQFEPALVHCLKARERCRGWQVSQQEIHRDRVGNFWLDLFGFRHVVKTTGWRFNGTIVLEDDLVVYKLWSGEPSVHAVDDERNPLGPLQGVGPALLPPVR